MEHRKSRLAGCSSRFRISLNGFIPSLFTPNPDPTTRMSQQESTLICKVFFSKFLSPNFCDHNRNVASVSCSCLAPGVTFCCCNPSASRFGVLLVQDPLRDYLSYCCLFISLNQFGHSTGISFCSQNLTHNGFFSPPPKNPRDGCSWKST